MVVAQAQCRGEGKAVANDPAISSLIAGYVSSTRAVSILFGEESRVRLDAPPTRAAVTHPGHVDWA